jgi:hypothetical protein
MCHKYFTDCGCLEGATSLTEGVPTSVLPRSKFKGMSKSGCSHSQAWISLPPPFMEVYCRPRGYSTLSKGFSPLPLAGIACAAGLLFGGFLVFWAAFDAFSEMGKSTSERSCLELSYVHPTMLPCPSNHKRITC